MFIHGDINVLARTKPSAKSSKCEWDSSQSIFFYGDATNRNVRSRVICAKIQAVPPKNHVGLLALQTAGR